MKFKVGDRVRTTKNFDEFTEAGLVGTVVDLNGAIFGDIAVEFDKAIGHGHNCFGKAKGGHGRWGHSEGLEPVCNRKIVITSDGVETLARLYEGNKVIKTATAKCSPRDTFDFEEGARIALHRILGDYAEVKAKKPTIAEGLKKCAEGVRKLADAVKAQPKSDEKWRVVDRPVKVGDYIRLVKKDFSFDEVGDILKVDKVTKTGSAMVYGRNHKRPTGDDNEDWLYLREEFEVVEPVEPVEPEQQTGHKFKVGDRVRRIEDGVAWRKGDTGTIVEVDNSAVPYRVKIDRNGDKHWSYEEFLEYIEEPEYFNGKVVCVKSADGFTVGKVYEFVNGQTTDNDGAKRPMGYRIVKSIDEYKKRSAGICEFIPFVE